MSDNTRTIPLKPHVVLDPNGKKHYAYAATKAGAIKAVRDTLPKPAEEWDAAVLTTQELIQLGRDRTPIINDPNPQGADEDAAN